MQVWSQTKKLILRAYRVWILLPGFYFLIWQNSFIFSFKYLFCRVGERVLGSRSLHLFTGPLPESVNILRNSFLASLTDLKELWSLPPRTEPSACKECCTALRAYLPFWASAACLRRKKLGRRNRNQIFWRDWSKSREWTERMGWNRWSTAMESRRLDNDSPTLGLTLRTSVCKMVVFWLFPSQKCC